MDNVQEIDNVQDKGDLEKGRRLTVDKKKRNNVYFFFLFVYISIVSIVRCL